MDAVKRGDADFAKWCIEDLDDWVNRQVKDGPAAGLCTTHRRRKVVDRLSITELGWGVGEIAKMWKLLKDNGIDHPLYLEFGKKMADFFVAHYDEQDPFGRIWSLKTGAKLEGGGDGGGFMVKGMLELHEVCGDKRYLDCARKAFDRYFEMDLGKFRCVAGADDCNCVDKESSFPYIYSALELYRQTGEKKYLECAERVAAYFCSWMFTYDALYTQASEFGRFGYHTSGGTLVSAEHQCIDPYSTVAVPDLFDLADATGNEVWREAGRLIWVNAIQDVAGPEGGSMNGILRTPGSQCEAHAQSRWAKYRSDPIAARGNFNNQCTAFLVTYRLYALDRLGVYRAIKKPVRRFIAITCLEPPPASPHAVHPCRKRQRLRKGKITAHAKAKPRPLPRLNQRKRIPIRREVWVLKRLEVAKLPERVVVAVAVAEERIPHTACAVEKGDVFGKPPVVAIEHAALELVERRTVQLVLLVVEHAQERTVAVKPPVISEVKSPVKVL